MPPGAAPCPVTLATAPELVAVPEEADTGLPVTVTIPEVNTAGTETVVVGLGIAVPRATGAELAPGKAIAGGLVGESVERSIGSSARGFSTLFYD